LFFLVFDDDPEERVFEPLERVDDEEELLDEPLDDEEETVLDLELVLL